MTDWQHIDSRSHTTASDAAMATQLGEALMVGDRLALELAATIHMMRDAMAGQPQAASYDSHGSPSAWCWTHERTVRACQADDRLCSGEIVASYSDPTGNAAVAGDRAAADLRELRRLVGVVCRVIDQAHTIAGRYPTQVAERTDIEAQPGEDWCRSCWRDAKHHEPVARRPNGQPYYRGLCQWCGRLAKDLGSAMPPLNLVAARHRGERITTPMVELARQDVKRRAKDKRRSKG